MKHTEDKREIRQKDKLLKLLELYKLSKEIYNREEERYKIIEEKATKCLTAFTLLIAVYSFLLKDVWGRLIPIQSNTPGVVVIIVVFSVMLLFLFILSWIKTFLTFNTRGRKVLPLNKEMIEYFDDDLIDIYKGLAKRNAEAYKINEEITDEEIVKLESGFRMILLSIGLFVMFIYLYWIYIFSYTNFIRSIDFLISCGLVIILTSIILINVYNGITFKEKQIKEE